MASLARVIGDLQSRIEHRITVRQRFQYFGLGSHPMPCRHAGCCEQYPTARVFEVADHRSSVPAAILTAVRINLSLARLPILRTASLSRLEMQPQIDTQPNSAVKRSETVIQDRKLGIV